MNRHGALLDSNRPVVNKTSVLRTVCYASLDVECPTIRLHESSVVLERSIIEVKLDGSIRVISCKG